MILNNEITELLKKVSIAYVGTSGVDNMPNVSIKGIVKYDAQKGEIFFLDLFKGTTEKNMLENPKVAISIVDHEQFSGYQLKGLVELISAGQEFDECVLHWGMEKHNRYRERIGSNMKKYMTEGFSEYNLPTPKHLVKLTVQEIINMVPEVIG